MHDIAEAGAAEEWEGKQRDGQDGKGENRRWCRLGSCDGRRAPNSCTLWDATPGEPKKY